MYSDAIKFGVAGNMTGHLEQAGEASDFVDVAAEAGAPKGMFPYHVPGATTFLGVDPVSSDTLRLPEGDDAERVQCEPEVALLCALSWDGTTLTGIHPRAFTAYDDASIRKPAAKISHKKNWGADSKGLGATSVALPDGLVPGCPLDRYHLVSFLRRDGVLHLYGEDSPVVSYGYFHERLTTWMHDRLASQTDGGPLEDLAAWLRVAGQPAEAVVGIGATRYTPFGADDRVRPGDVVTVVVYDASTLSLADVRAAVEAGEALPEGNPTLTRTVVA
jgi:hypothetical protein